MTKSGGNHRLQDQIYLPYMLASPALAQRAVLDRMYVGQRNIPPKTNGAGMAGDLVAATGLQAVFSVGNEHTVRTEHTVSLMKIIDCSPGVSGTVSFLPTCSGMERLLGKPSYLTSQKNFQNSKLLTIKCGQSGILTHVPGREHPFLPSHTETIFKGLV